MDGYIDGWMGGWMDRWMDGWMDGCLNAYMVRQDVMTDGDRLSESVSTCIPRDNEEGKQ